jgi:four helix bundle protein
VEEIWRMATIERFEDIQARRKARELTRVVYQMTQTGEFGRDFALRNQIRRAAVSAMANIAEGFERCGNKEFQQFLAMAKGSAGEVRSHLYVALDAGFISPEQFDRLHDLVLEIGRMIGGFMTYLQQTDFKGTKKKAYSAIPKRGS